MRLKELEKRLEKEPNNLGLRVTVAGALHEAGRTVEAIELYRSVALAYRDGGRRQQAIAVCRSILELAPEDDACRSLLASLTLPAQPLPPIVAAAPEPKRRSSVDPTPLPKPVPYHVVDPTSGRQRLSPGTIEDLPTSEGADTRPGDEPRRESSGLADAARRISGWISGDTVTPTGDDDLAAELDTRQRPRIDDSEALRKISQPPPTIPTEKVELDDELTPLRESEELTQPRDKLDKDK